MHEMSICEGIMAIIEQQAKSENYREVKKIFLEIGQFSGIELEALHFSFGVVANGTCAENAKLEIKQTNAEAWCMPCAKAVTVSQRYDACPNCGSYQLQVTGGDELKILELEVN